MKTLTEKGKMDDGGAPQWLETRRVWDAGDRLIEVKGPMKGDEPVGWVKALIDHHGYPYKIERMLQEGVWATRTYGYTHLGALRRTEDSTKYLVEYKSDKFGRIDEYDYKGAGSRDLKKRGFRFVGSTICYAFMQATGLVNDHLISCFRHSELMGRS